MATMEVNWADVGERFQGSFAVIISICGIIIVGSLAYFMLIPSTEPITTFITYLSSLSTICLVIIYIFTDTRQLQIMRRQLDEMEFSRNVQYHPLISMGSYKCKLDLPQFYSGPEEDFKVMELLSRFHFVCTSENIGNSPAINLISIPELRSVQNDILVNGFVSTVEYLSLKDGDTGDVHFFFLDPEHKILQSLYTDYEVIFNIITVYKNTLNMSFKQSIAYRARANRDTYEDIIKSIRLLKTVDMDYDDDVVKYNRFAESGDRNSAREIMRAVNTEIKGKTSEEAELDIHIESGTFRVDTISDEEYTTVLSEHKDRLGKYYERYIR